MSDIPPPATYGALSDSQLSQAFTQLSAARSVLYTPNAVPPPQTVPQSKAYSKNVYNWSSNPTAAPKTPASGTRSTRARTAGTRSSNLATNTTASYTPQQYQPTQYVPAPATTLATGLPKPPIPTTTQALHTTYSSRLRTGTTLLVQPIFSAPAASTSRAASRRGVINYADPGSGDDMPDAGALDSDDSDFIASGGTRTSVRQVGSGSRARMATGMSVFNSTTGVTTIPHAQLPPKPEKAELDQSYLGMLPPARFIKARPAYPTQHKYPSVEDLESHSRIQPSLVPIRVEFETDTMRVRDCFVWNQREALIKPEDFANIFCQDLDLPAQWVDIVAAQIKTQLEEHEGVANLGLGMDGVIHADSEINEDGPDIPECRVILGIDVQIANHHLVDYIEWDLLSPLTPETFASKLCNELGLTGEAIPLVSHAIHEELIKHKRDAIEWGVIGGDRETDDSKLKDKTGLGLSWGRAPKDGRGPKVLKSIWRDWADQEDLRTRFEILTPEEIERREGERERASRRLRRETSKFQNSRSRRRG